MDRTLRTAALRATSSPRKTARMIRKARATTTPMISGSRSATMSRKSTWAAVVPVTYPLASVPVTAAGRVVSTRRLVRSVVEALCGDCLE